MAAQPEKNAPRQASVPHGCEQSRPSSKRIGEILVDLGYVTAAVVEEAVRCEQDAGLQLGARLLRRGTITETQLAHALAVRLGVGFTDLAHVSDIQPGAVSLVPERIARRYLLVPLSATKCAVRVAMHSPGNVFAIDAVRAATGLEVEVMAAPESAIRRAIDHCYSFGATIESTASDLADVEVSDAYSAADASGVDVGQLRNEAEDAPVVKYVDSLIAHAIRDRASDIHIEPGRGVVSVRLRIDGRLRATPAPPKAMQNAVISRVKILANLDIAEKRLPLDGRIRAQAQGREVDLRVSTLPTIHGEKVVLRVLDKNAVLMDLDKLSADTRFLAHFKGILKRPNGMILVTGPTGSGKTTTLYAALNAVRDVAKNIVSVEDPVEYEMEGITQVPVRTEIGMTFARALRSILRQDPDVVLVGEMRDLDTLEIGIRASLTGHLVLSTLHTNDAVATVSRMINMGAEPYLIASTVISCVAQRLVRAICLECREEIVPSDADRRRMEALLGMPAPAKVWRGCGCPRCGKTGYYGRTAVYEYFHIDAAAREMITNRASESQLRDHQRAHSTGSLAQTALRAALEGITTVEEALQLDTSS